MSTSIQAISFTEILRAIQRAVENNSTAHGFLQDLHCDGFMVVPIPPPEPIPTPNPEPIAVQMGFGIWLDVVVGAGGAVNRSNAANIAMWRKHWLAGTTAHTAVNLEMPF